MSKIFDFIALFIALFLVNLFWCGYAFDKFWLAAIVALALAALLAYLISKLITREDRRPYSVEKFARELALRGNGFVLELLAEATGFGISEGGDFLSVGSEKALFSVFKFTDVGLPDIASVYQKSAEHGITEAVVLGRSIERAALIFAESLPIRITFVRAARLFRFLKNKGLLPALTTAPKHGKIPLKMLLNIVFARRNVKFFLFTAVMLGFLSYFTPLKIYYIVMSSISVALALLSLFISGAQA
ncbi:MAG TPA: hypothetical protein P5161_07150, partial [Eubacteriales bacterium]|nr:hypothetical protein [Eubacteriales bacterium]